LPSVPSRGLYRFYERHGSLLPNCFHRGGVEG
jgi:hypothetical protein